MRPTFREIIDALEPKLPADCRITGRKDGKHVNFTPNWEKFPFQAIDGADFVGVGLVFDDPDRGTNQMRAERYERELEDDLRSRRVRPRRNSNIAFLEHVPVAGLTADQAAEAVLASLAWWRDRFAEEPSEPADL